MTSTTRLVRRWRRRTHDERGITLIELVVAMVLVSGVFAIAAAIFTIALRGDSQVHTTTQATMQAQAIAQGIEKSVRNAVRIHIAGSTLTVGTTLDGARTCQQWSLAGSGGTATIQFAQGSTTPGSATDFAGTAAIKGATLTLAATGSGAGVIYAVSLPSKTRPVEVSGTVRSRTPQVVTSMCGLT